MAMSMFEGKPPEAHTGRNSGSGAPPEEDLRVLSWSDLVARLEAARDLREQISAGEEAGVASFDAHCARRLAAQHDFEEGNGKQAVNPDDLANGKWAAGNEGSRADNEPPDTRGIK